MNRIEKQNQLILDDFALQPLDSSRLALLEIMEDRHGRHPTLITSQLPVSKWYEVLEESPVIDETLDRLVHIVNRIGRGVNENVLKGTPYYTG